MDKDSLHIAAAASLTDVITTFSETFKESLDIDLEINFASSSILAKQISNGLKCDLYISANPVWVRYLVERNFIDRSNVKPLFANALIVVLSRESRIDINTLYDLDQKAIQTIAIGDPAHVPAGMYTKTAFEKIGLWNRIQTKLVGTVDVRAALAFVQNNAVDCGIVYQTDIFNSQAVKMACTIPDSLLTDLRYVSGIVGSGDNKLAQQFLSFLIKPSQQKILIKHGFIPL